MTVSPQTWTPETYERHARFVSDLGAGILAWLAPKPGERILDLGCGDGALTAEIARMGAVPVGVDTSEELLTAAEDRGLQVLRMDGQELTFAREFDAVFSNAALHWMRQPGRVLEGIARALKPGGRFVAEFGGHGNVAAIVTAIRSAALAFGGDVVAASPWFYPTVAEYTALLEASGFSVGRIELKPRPTPLPSGMEGWLMTFRKAFFDSFDGETKTAAIAHTVALLKPSLCDSDGQWTADYVRLKVEARLR